VPGAGTARVARRRFPKGALAIRGGRDELGACWYGDAGFAAGYAGGGGSRGGFFAGRRRRLGRVVTGFFCSKTKKYAENLTDRAGGADAVAGGAAGTGEKVTAWRAGAGGRGIRFFFSGRFCVSEVPDRLVGPAAGRPAGPTLL